MAGPGRRLRWTQGAVGLSIALNLFFVAFIGAQAWRFHHGAGRFAQETADGIASGIAMSGVLRQAMGTLPPEDGRILRDAFAARLTQLIALQRQSMTATDRARTDIAQTPFDAEKLKSDMLEARRLRQQISPIVEDALLDAVPRMSTQGRLRLSQYRLLPRR